MDFVSPTEHIEFAIINNFLGLDELATMSMVSKSYNQLAKREIKKIYKIIEIIRSSKIIVNHSSLYSTQSIQNCKYDRDYWYQLFGRKLNHQELAIYYAYFITSYIMSGSNWSCVAFTDGFIKLLGARSDGSVSISQKEPELFIRIHDYNCENLYISVKQGYLIDFDYPLFDKKLLKKCVNYIFQNTQYTDTHPFRSIKPTINQAIENLYPILTL